MTHHSASKKAFRMGEGKKGCRRSLMPSSKNALFLLLSSFLYFPGRRGAAAAFAPARSRYRAAVRSSAIPTLRSVSSDDGQDSECQQLLGRRETLTRVAAAAVASATDFRIFSTPEIANADDEMSNGEPVRFGASWSAADGLRSSDGSFVTFDLSAYKAMRDDPSRTPYFRRALTERLNASPGGPESASVLDLGTGPFALFAILAAEAGAGKVYAIESDPECARNARALIKKAGWSDVITVLEGFSTDVTLPNDDRVDVVVAEIVGSVASEEGAYATISDAHARFVKEPNDPASWIPNRIQTYAAPASYTLHNMFGPPDFDWNKLNGEPVRFNCRDEGLQLLSDPVLLEDISFADISRATQSAEKKAALSFEIDARRMEKNEGSLYANLRSGQLPEEQATAMAKATAHSFSGIAFWPRLVLDKGGSIVVNTRTYPEGGHQRSHWQTVLPICSERPIGDLKGGEKVVVSANFELSDSVTKSSLYNLKGQVFV